MAEIGTMKDVYTVAQFVGISGNAIDRFVKTLEATGYELKHKASQSEAEQRIYCVVDGNTYVPFISLSEAEAYAEMGGREMVVLYKRQSAPHSK